ncbi:CRISPR-associated protein Csx11 [Thermotoga profunda]|uniref:CRISPR-associated protein Csx11 n=1 Tax=Thermotoga profunda TaxID=1508420 RepID=UPI000A73B82D|nr:CRISPR-associated protein Csx11 [Thermotoga profunda]
MSILETLSKNRTPILLAEIGAYLHLIGRFSKEFLESHVKNGSISPNFDYQKICSDPAFFESTGLDKILSDQRLKSFIKFNTNANIGELTKGVDDFCEFIQKHTWRDSPYGLCQILADAHGIVSGIDKSLAGILENKQRKDYTFRSTVFGYEKEIELLKNPDLKRQLFEELYQILNDIFAEIATNQQISYENYRKFLSTVAKYYPKTIGETRRPINEISLYDYAYSIASLMKSNLAKMLVDGWYEPQSKSKWTVFSVNLDIPGLLSKGLKIGDILGYRSQTENLFNEIKKFVEYDYSFGNEIYRDGTGIYFSCPVFEKIDEFLKEIMETFLNSLSFDVSLHAGISRNSRSMTVIANERVKALGKISFSYTSGAEHWRNTVINENHENKFVLEKCPVCGIRMKLEKGDRCKVCNERYENRAEVWNKDPKATIWIDEVSDGNDRIAMIVGKFNLNKWLSGEMLDTLTSTTFVEWKNKNSTLCSKIGIHEIEDLEREFQDMFKNPKLNRDGEELLKSFVDTKINDFNKFWHPIAERDATGYALNLVDNKEKARYLVKLLFRKHPSFARLRRIWLTTQEFIDEVFGIIRNTFGVSDPRTKRIKLVISPNPSIPKNSTCDVIVNGARFSPVCIDDTRSIFISTTNLEILNKFGKTVEEIAKTLSGQDIKLKTEEEKNWKDFKIIEAKPANDEFQDYLPYIEIYDFPDQFMVLVPAYEALSITEKILMEYEKQFSKVRDRLPLHLGIIAFHRRTPLYIVMDAAKRLLKGFEMSKTIEAKVLDVEDIEDQELGKCRKLKLQTDGRDIPLSWIISHSTKDPGVEDLWYPYLRIPDKLQDRDLSFDYTGNGDYVVHVKKMKKGDKLKIEPSYFKLCYIEESSDRFFVDENFGFIDDIHTIQCLWKFVVDKLKSGSWTVSQLYNFWGEFEKIKKYDEKTSEYFLESNLINILGLDRSSNEFEFLKKAIKDELFELCLYWNLQVRKEKVGKGD